MTRGADFNDSLASDSRKSGIFAAANRGVAPAFPRGLVDHLTLKATQLFHYKSSYEQREKILDV